MSVLSAFPLPPPQLSLNEVRCGLAFNYSRRALEGGHNKMHRAHFSPAVSVFLNQLRVTVKNATCAKG